MAAPAIPDRLKTKLNAVATTLTKTDRIITGNMRLGVVMGYGVPAHLEKTASYTDGQTITINPIVIPDLGSSSTLVTLLGLNYHELCHCLYSPRSECDFRQTVQHRGHHFAFNILEDQRIEALFGARYGSASKFFAAPVMKLIVNNRDSWATAHLLTYGRRYLPLEIREELANQFIGDDVLRDEAEMVIDRYRKITFEDEREFDKALRLIKRFADVLEKLRGVANPNQLNALTQHECSSTPHAGKMDSQAVAASRRLLEDQDTDQDAAEMEGRDGSGFWEDEDEDSPEDEQDGHDGDSGTSAEDDDDYDDEDDESESGSDGSSAADGSADGESGDDDSHSESGDGSDMSGDPSGSGDASENGEEGDSEGRGPSDVNSEGGYGGEGDHELSDAEALAEEILAAIESDPEVAEQITTIRNAIDNTASTLEVDLPELHGRKMPVPPELASAYRASQQVLARLFADLEAGWYYRTDSGRLNVSSVMENPEDPDVWFDEFTEGHDQDAGLEVCIMVDISASMKTNDPKQNASKALWVLCRALEEIDASVSVIAFGSNTRKIKGRNERVSASHVTLYAANDGATMPAEGMREARRIMSESDKPNKLFVILTDGGFSSSSYEYDAAGNYTIVSPKYGTLLKEIDATRVYLGLNYISDASYMEAFDVRSKLTDAKGLVSVVQSFTEAMLRSAASR